MSRVVVHPEVDAALRDGRPVVALESAVLTCGLPTRTPAELGLTTDGLPDALLDAIDAPVNLAAAHAMHRAVREHGAVPATVAVLDGLLRIGLDDDDLARLAATGPVGPKAASRDLSALIGPGHGVTAGTTVSATLAACALPERPIRVMATGGIGGVHRGWTSRPDVSADLGQLARAPVCVVCSGAKSILDVPATLEAMESLAIPVLGYRTDCFARFYCAGVDGGTARRVESAAAVAAICRAHWSSLGASGGLLLAQPVPRAHAIDEERIEQAVRQAEDAAASSGIDGAALTPFLLAVLAERTEGRAVVANLALLAANASLAGELACELA